MPKIPMTPALAASIEAARKKLGLPALKADSPWRAVESSSAPRRTVPARAPKSTAALRAELEQAQAKSRSVLRALGLSDTEISDQIRQLRQGTSVETLVRKFMAKERLARSQRVAQRVALASRMGVVAPKPLGIIETATSLKLGVPLAAHPQREHDRAELARRMGVARDAPLIISSPTKLTLNAPANSARTSRADMHERLNLDQGELAPDASGRRPN